MSAERPNAPPAKSELSKSSDASKNNVPPIQEGRLLENPLSEREMEVARLLSTGASNSEIAHSLIISPHTVKVHLRNIFEKLEVNSRTEASMLLVQRGWLTVPGVEVSSITESETETAVVAALPPDPEPLTSPPFQLAGWHRAAFVGLLLIAIGALVVPSISSRASAAPSLFSDAGQIGATAAEVLSIPRWQQLTSLPEPRSRAAAVFLQDKLILIGGETTGGRLLDTVDGYDFALNDWRALPKLPMPLSNSSAALISGTVYVAGGTEAASEGGEPQISNHLLRWQEGEDSWSTFVDLPNPLTGASLVADGESLYLIGGWDGERMRDEVLRLSPNVEAETLPSWQHVTRLEKPRAFVGASIVDNQLYVVGGSDGQKNYDLTNRYDLQQGKWNELRHTPFPRQGFALVYDGSALFMLGGDETNPQPIHQRYDINVDEWTNIPSPVQGAWRNLSAVSVDGRIFMVGGWSGDYLSSVLEYQSSYRLLLPVISKDQ